MDAMVTARMPEGKKLAAAQVLNNLGINASQLINEVWDYLIREKEAPQLSAAPAQTDRQQRYAEALAWMDGLLALTQPNAHFDAMSDDEIRLEYYKSKGYFDGIELED